MSDMIVLVFDNEANAFQMRDKLLSLQKQQLISLADAAIVVRKENGKPKIKQLHSLVGAGALGGAFWGMLFGLLFFVPWFGLAVGAAFGALGGKMRDYGIDDDFINSVREQVTEGTSAVFLLTDKAVRDKVADELKGENFELIASNLTKDQEDELMEIFSGE